MPHPVDEHDVTNVQNLHPKRLIIFYKNTTLNESSNIPGKWFRSFLQSISLTNSAVFKRIDLKAACL